MSTQVMQLAQGDILKVDAVAGMGVAVHAGRVWVTQHDDRHDYMLKRGEGMALKDRGTTMISAFEPSLLELYRQDASGLRKAIEAEARTRRSRELFSFIARIFR